jgi:hypothetical protein
MFLDGHKINSSSPFASCSIKTQICQPIVSLPFASGIVTDDWVSFVDVVTFVQWSNVRDVFTAVTIEQILYGLTERAVSCDWRSPFSIPNTTK